MMIDAKELRVGNFVNLDLGPYKGIQLHKIKAADIVSVENGFVLLPIPLTESILLKCGFEKTSSFTVFKKDICDNGDIIMVGLLGSGTYLMSYGDKVTIGAPIKFVHELQNIYYWLSGKKELKIEL